MGGSKFIYKYGGVSSNGGLVNKWWGNPIPS